MVTLWALPRELRSPRLEASVAAWDGWPSVLSPLTQPQLELLMARGPACQHVAWVSVLQVPNWDRRDEVSALCDHAEPSHVASCKLFKGLCVFPLGDATGDGDEDKDVCFPRAKNRRGRQPWILDRVGCLGIVRPFPLLFRVSTSPAPLASPCLPPQTLPV